jgi:hypothetical protein
MSSYDDWISPSNSVTVAGSAEILDTNTLHAVDVAVASGSAEAIIEFEGGQFTLQADIFPESISSFQFSLDTMDQYYGLTSTETPFPAPQIANPEYGQNGDGIAIGLGVIKYNIDNFVITVGEGVVSFTESVGHSDDSTITGTADISAQDLFPTYGTVIGNSDIRDLSQVTMLNKPAQSYQVVITGAVGNGTQIVYNAINNFVAGESIVIDRNRPSDPADWWCVGAEVIDSSTGTTFTVLNASTGTYSSSPENDGYALIVSSAGRYGVGGLQRYPSQYEDFKYSISALESYTYQAALTSFSGGGSIVAGDLSGAPFVLAAEIGGGSDVESFLVVFIATQTSGYDGQGNPAGVYGTGVYGTSIYGGSSNAFIENIITSNNVTCSFSSSFTIFETQYKCTFDPSEFNFSLNPSLISGSNGNVYDFVTGSYFNPYVTTVGLYNENQDLIAVGKLAKPLPSNNVTDTTILINIDR